MKFFFIGTSLHDGEKLVLIEKCFDPEYPEEEPLMESKISLPLWMFHDIEEARAILQEAVEGEDGFSTVCHQMINATSEHGTANGTGSDVALEVIKTPVDDKICVGGESGK